MGYRPCGVSPLCMKPDDMLQQSSQVPIHEMHGIMAHRQGMRLHIHHYCVVTESDVVHSNER
jgi:hypothetical protein